MAVPVFLMITGYLSAKSFQRNDSDFWRMYYPNAILSKLLRFVLPFFTAFLIELLIKEFVLYDRLSPVGTIKSFLVGGFGPGAYYIPIMIQAVFTIPLVYLLMKKMLYLGLTICFTVNILFELAKNIINMSVDYYRLCSFRYLFVLAFGCFVYFFCQEERSAHKSFFEKTSILIGLLGGAYIALYTFGGLSPVITCYWPTTSVFAALYIVPVFLYLAQQKQIKNAFLQLLGEASFEIFLMQMMYYWFGFKYVYSITNSEHSLPINGKYHDLLFRRNMFSYCFKSYFSTHYTRCKELDLPSCLIVFEPISQIK